MPFGDQLEIHPGPMLRGEFEAKQTHYTYIQHLTSPSFAVDSVQMLVYRVSVPRIEYGCMGDVK